jgi:hypothetical protein
MPLDSAAIECWRMILSNAVGPRAVTMSEKEIEEIHDNMQNDYEAQQEMLKILLPIGGR